MENIKKNKQVKENIKKDRSVKQSIKKNRQVKDINAYFTNKVFVCLFILAEDGKPVAKNGTLKIEIKSAKGLTVYKDSNKIKKQDFMKYEIDGANGKVNELAYKENILRSKIKQSDSSDGKLKLSFTDKEGKEFVSQSADVKDLPTD